jgi:hypothetical protein
VSRALKTSRCWIVPGRRKQRPSGAKENPALLDSGFWLLNSG